MLASPLSDAAGARPQRRTTLADDAEAIMDIGKVLREQDIMLGMPARGKRSALAKIAASLAKRARASDGEVLAALLRRERLGSTGIGHGVAVPHARLDGIEAPAAMLVRLEKPVCFDAPDSDPVDLVLALLWPKADVARFLPALSRMSRLLRSADLRERLRSAQTAAEAFAWLRLHEPPSAARPAVGPRRAGGLRPLGVGLEARA